LEHSETIINGSAPALLAAVVEHVRPLPLRDRSSQKAQHESARAHTHTLALSLSLLFSSSLFSRFRFQFGVVLWTSSLFLWFRFQFDVWSCDHPPSSSGSGSSLVHGLVIILPLHLVPVPVPVPVWCVFLWSSSLFLRPGSSSFRVRVLVFPLLHVPVPPWSIWYFGGLFF
jgi:hypothetical protein